MFSGPVQLLLLPQTEKSPSPLLPTYQPRCCSVHGDQSCLNQLRTWSPKPHQCPHVLIRRGSPQPCPGRRCWHQHSKPSFRMDPPGHCVFKVGSWESHRSTDLDLIPCIILLPGITPSYSPSFWGETAPKRCFPLKDGHEMASNSIHWGVISIIDGTLVQVLALSPGQCHPAGTIMLVWL